MTWNYRVLKRIYYPDTPAEEITFCIGEVYYSESGELKAYSDLAWPLGSSVVELGRDLEMMKEALSKPVILIDGDEMVEIT